MGIQKISLFNACFSASVRNILHRKALFQESLKSRRLGQIQRIGKATIATKYAYQFGEYVGFFIPVRG